MNDREGRSWKDKDIKQGHTDRLAIRSAVLSHLEGFKEVADKEESFQTVHSTQSRDNDFLHVQVSLLSTKTDVHVQVGPVTRIQKITYYKLTSFPKTAGSKITPIMGQKGTNPTWVNLTRLLGLFIEHKKLGQIDPSGFSPFNPTILLSTFSI